MIKYIIEIISKFSISNIDKLSCLEINYNDLKNSLKLGSFFSKYYIIENNIKKYIKNKIYFNDYNPIKYNLGTIYTFKSTSKFDVIIISNNLENLIVGTYDKILSLLKDGGLMIIVQPRANPKNWDDEKYNKNSKKFDKKAWNKKKEKLRFISELLISKGWIVFKRKTNNFFIYKHPERFSVYNDKHKNKHN